MISPMVLKIQLHGDCGWSSRHYQRDLGDSDSLEVDFFSAPASISSLSFSVLSLLRHNYEIISKQSYICFVLIKSHIDSFTLLF